MRPCLAINTHFWPYFVLIFFSKTNILNFTWVFKNSIHQYIKSRIAYLILMIFKNLSSKIYCICIIWMGALQTLHLINKFYREL